jgi:hypothetical protein
VEGKIKNEEKFMMDTKEDVAAAWEVMKEGSTVIYP